MSTEQVEDEWAIHKLAAAYSHAVMRLDGDAAAAVYAEDAVLSAFYKPEIVGRAAIAQALRVTLQPLAFLVQTCAAGVVEVQGDRAQATWSVSEFVGYKDRPGVACCFGAYEDTLARGASGWRFNRRRFLPFHRGPLSPEGKAYPAPGFAQSLSPWPPG